MSQSVAQATQQEKGLPTGMLAEAQSVALAREHVGEERAGAQQSEDTHLGVRRCRAHSGDAKTTDFLGKRVGSEDGTWMLEDI